MLHLPWENNLDCLEDEPPAALCFDEVVTWESGFKKMCREVVFRVTYRRQEDSNLLSMYISLSLLLESKTKEILYVAGLLEFL